MIANVGRVRRLTAEEVNSQLQAEAEIRVAYYASHPEEIDNRLRELDEEWDIERAIEMESAGTILAGFFLGVTVSRKWFLVPVFASAMLLLHNLHGNYPLLPLFRRLGFRTAREIARERYALKAVRGDFERVAKADGATRLRTAFAAAHPNNPAVEHEPVPASEAPGELKGENHGTITNKRRTAPDRNPGGGKHSPPGQPSNPATD